MSSYFQQLAKDARAPANADSNDLLCHCSQKANVSLRETAVFVSR